MKRLYKALALSLLLALVLSAFGMFSTFAQGSDTTDPAEFRTLYDIENATEAVKMSNVGGSNPNYPVMKEYVEGDQPYWSISFEGTKAGDSANANDYLKTDFKNEWDVLVRDDKGYGSRAAASKNTNYIIFDLDVATETEFINDIYFNCRLLKSGATAYNANTVSGSYPAIKRTDDGGFVVCNTDGSNPVAPLSPITGKWANVTLVYDFTADTNVTYVYIDGYYCGNIASFGAATAIIYFVRLQTVNSGTLALDNMSTNIANFTIKSVSTEYDGLMTEEGVLGNSAMPLYAIPELAYCLEDLPEVGSKVADIVRGNETIPVYSTDDITADLQNGDTVKLYQKLTEKLFVPAGETVTVLDMAGNDITASCVNSIPAGGTKWIAISGSDVTYGSEPATADNDPLYAAISDSAATKLILLEDYATYGDASKTAAKGLVIDLNGNKLTVNASGSYVAAADGAFTLVKDGSLELLSGSLVSSVSPGVVRLDRVDATVVSDALLSLTASGAIECEGSSINGNGQAIRLSSAASTVLNVVISGSEINSGAASSIALSGASSGNTVVDLSVTDSIIGSSSAAAITMDMPAPSTDFSFVLDAEISDTKLAGTYFFEQLSSGYTDGTDYGDAYSYAANFTMTDVELRASNADKAVANKAAKLSLATVSLDIYGEVTAPSNDVSAYLKCAEGAASDNNTVNLSSDGSWILRSLPEIAGYYSYTTNLDSHSYILNEHEYEFYAYVGDPVNENNIPEKLPAESSLLAYRWEYNIDGAYEGIITYKGDIKANVTASDSLALNVYLPDDFGDDAYNYVYANGNRASVYDVAHDGESYKAITIPGIDPLSATKDFKIKFRVVDENGTVADVVCYVSVLDYIESALKSDALTAEEKQLVAALLNYIAKAEKYGSMNGENSAAVKALLDSTEYGAIVLPTPAAGEAKSSVGSLGVFSGLRLSLDTNVTYELAVKDGFAGQITVSYTKGGNTVTETLDVEAGDVVKVSMLAYELDTTVTVSYGTNSGEINLAGYMSLIPDSAKGDDFAALAEAIAIYATAADAYKN